MTGGAAVYPFISDLLQQHTSANTTTLELGCGAMQYAPFVKGSYLGLDLPTSDHVRERPHFVGSAEHLPLADGSVDVVFGVATFYYMDRIDRVFSECHRVLRPGGRLLVFDYQRHVIRRLLDDGDTTIRHVWGVRDLRRYLRNAGFRPWHIHDLSHRAGEGHDPPLFSRPVRLVKRYVLAHRRHWLALEARR